MPIILLVINIDNRIIYMPFLLTWNLLKDSPSKFKVYDCQKRFSSNLPQIPSNTSNSWCVTIETYIEMKSGWKYIHESQNYVEVAWWLNICYSVVQRKRGGCWEVSQFSDNTLKNTWGMKEKNWQWVKWKAGERTSITSDVND